jgi:uncharacterized protein (DUF2267 family)
MRDWYQGQKADAFSRAQDRVKLLLTEYVRPNFPPEQIIQLQSFVEKLARDAGMQKPIDH